MAHPEFTREKVEEVPGTPFWVALSPSPSPIRGLPDQYRVYSPDGYVIGGSETKDGAVELAKAKVKARSSRPPSR